MKDRTFDESIIAMCYTCSNVTIQHKTIIRSGVVGILFKV